MSHPEIIDDCKKITVEHLIGAIGRDNIVSIILYGSVARNEETYKNVNGKLFLESDLDVLVVVKNNIILVKSLLQIRRLDRNISALLKEKRLLSHVNLAFTTEARLLHTGYNYFHLHLKLNGKEIFGKELIKLMPNYGYAEYEKIPIPCLNSSIFGFMMNLVGIIAMSGIINGTATAEGYDSIAKSIRKLTLFMIRAIIVKDSVPLNPYNLTEIKMKRRSLETSNSAFFNELLDTYDDIKSNEPNEGHSISDIQRYIVRSVRQFNSTIAIVTGTNYSVPSLPRKSLFGNVPFIRRLEYIFYIFLINITAAGNLDILKYMFIMILDPSRVYALYYDLFISSPQLMTPSIPEDKRDYHQRESWLRLYSKTIKPWKYNIPRN